MTSSQNPILIASGTLILLTILGGLFALVWHGSIPAVDALGVVGTIAAAAVGALVHASGVNAGANAAVSPTTSPSQK